jgi:DNA polymerase I-like protein with 3'-5' exonuclease and polymerase domains
MFTVEEHFEHDWEPHLPPWMRDPDPEVYLGNNYVVIDFETDVEDYGNPLVPENDIIFSAWENGPDHERPGAFEQWGNELTLQQLVEDIESADFFVAQNAKFECGWLKRCGLPLHKMLPFCTQMAEYCRYTNQANTKYKLNLGSILPRYGLPEKDRIGRLIRLGMDTRDIPPMYLKRYGRKDTATEHQLFLLQRQYLKENGLLPVFFTRNILTPLLCEFEGNGMTLDPERVGKVKERVDTQVHELDTAMAILMGGASPKQGPQMRKALYAPTSEGGLGFAIPKMGKKEMLTPKGEPQTSADALDRLVVRTKKQQKFIDIRKVLSKFKDKKSKYTDKMWACCEEAAGKLVARFNQMITDTMRLSCSGTTYKMQLQNIDNELKPCFTARHRDEGWKVGESDAAQLEFRVGVQLTRDRQGLEDIRNDVDAHARTASILFPSEWNPDLGPKEGDNKDARDKGKPETFRPMYGGKGMTKEQNEYAAWWQEHYHQMYETQMSWVMDCARDGYYTTETGVRFFFPHTRPNKWGQYSNMRNIFNFPIQMTATSDMVPTAAVYIWHCMVIIGMKSFLVNCVHDSVIGELHPDECEDWGNLCQFMLSKHIKWYMKKVYGMKWVVPLDAETKIGTHWASSPKWEKEWLGTDEDSPNGNAAEDSGSSCEPTEPTGAGAQPVQHAG